MSHRPKVPSTLKFLEGVEVSFLLSLKFFNFLFLYQESQVSRFPKRAPGSHEWARPSVLCRTHRRTAHVACGGPHVPMSLLQEQRTLGDHGLAGSHTTFAVAEQHLNRPTGRPGPGWPPATSQCCCHLTLPREVESSRPGPQLATRHGVGPTPHLPAIELVVPVVKHGGTAGHYAVPDSIQTDSRHLPVPRQNCNTHTGVSTSVGSWPHPLVRILKYRLLVKMDVQRRGRTQGPPVCGTVRDSVTLK